MKKLKRIFAVLFVIAMVASLCTTAFAAKPTDGTITVKNAVKGATYKIYKLFDAELSGSGSSVTYTYSGTFAADSGFSKGAQNVVIVDDSVKDLEGNLNADAVAYLLALCPSSATATKECTDGKAVTFTGLSYGYYIVKNTTVATNNVATIDTAAKDVVVYDKNESKPGPEEGTEYKTIKDGEEEKTSVVASIGDKLDQTITFKAVNFIVEEGEATQVTSYTVKDTASNMSIDWTTLSVSVDGTALTVNSDYTLDSTTGTITINWIGAENATLYANPAKVVITYTAEVMDVDATNSVEITYKVLGGDEDEPVTPEEEPKTEVVCYNVTIKNLKDDAPLAGAVYALKDSEGATMNLVKVEEGVYRLANSEDSISNIVTNVSAGVVTIKGLGNGDYSVEQVTPTQGYDAQADKDFTIADADEIVEFVNTDGLTLPTTGSTGTAILMVIGTITVMAAGLFLVANKRMSKENF